MKFYFRFLSLVILLSMVLSFGCSHVLFFKNKGKSRKRPQQSSISRIKHYRKIIQETLPFKDIIWEATTSYESIKDMTLIEDFLYVETDKLKLRAYTTDIGHQQWILSIKNHLDFPPCDVKGLSAREIAIKKRITELQKQLRDEETQKERDEDKIKILNDRLRSNKELIKGLIGSDMVYFISKGNLYCVDRWWGTELWSKRLRFVPRAGPIASYTTVYISSLDFDRVYMFDNTRLYERDWIKLSSPVKSMPIYEDPALYFACDNGTVYSFNADTAKKIWEYPTERSIKNDIVLDGDIIYTGSTDFALYAIDRHLGTLRWKYETGLPITSAPQIGIRRIKRDADILIEKTLFIKVDLKEEMHALLLNAPSDPKPYELRWKFPQGKKFLLYGLASTYVLGKDNQTVYSLDIEKGNVLNTYSLEEFPFRAVDANEPILYLGTPDGYIFAVREPPPKW